MNNCPHIQEVVNLINSMKLKYESMDVCDGQLTCMECNDWLDWDEIDSDKVL